MGCAFVGAWYQILQERRVRRAEPERFPPGQVEALALSCRRWRRGLWHFFPRTAEQRSMRRLRRNSRAKTIHEQTTSVADSAIRTVYKTVSLVADLPWFIDDLISTNKAPPNPADGPSLVVTRAVGVPRGDFPVYVAVSVSLDGGSKYEYICRTEALEWQAVEGERACPRSAPRRVAPRLLTRMRARACVSAQACTRRWNGTLGCSWARPRKSGAARRGCAFCFWRSIRLARQKPPRMWARASRR